MAYRRDGLEDAEILADYYVSSKPEDLARDLLDCRADRLLLIWRILNRTYNDHLIKPAKMPTIVWEPLKRRFTVTDLASPVLSTINSATYGGKVRRVIKQAYNAAEIEKFLTEARHNDFVPMMHRDAVAYGTSYAVVGRRKGKASLVRLHPLSTRISCNKTDVEDIRAVCSVREDGERFYTELGIVEKRTGGDKRTLANTGYGFIPVTIGRARWMDACTPYGQDLIWPAVEETKQVTALMCDLMVLERSQSYSTLVIKGSLLTNQQESGGAPFVNLRGEDDGDSKFEAYYISPDAKIKEINDIIESKFERTATQCQVPVELFVRAKAGTQQGTGAAMLQHKPLYDLVIEQQKLWRDVEMDLIARIDAFLEFEKTGQPQDIDKFRQYLKMEIEFEHETHPAYNQAEVQTWAMLVEEGFKTWAQAFEHFNQFPQDEVKRLMEEAKAEMEERESAAMELQESKLAKRGVGDGSDAKQQSRDRDGVAA